MYLLNNKYVHSVPPRRDYSLNSRVISSVIDSFEWVNHVLRCRKENRAHSILRDRRSVGTSCRWMLAHGRQTRHDLVADLIGLLREMVPLLVSLSLSLNRPRSPHDFSIITPGYSFACRISGSIEFLPVSLISMPRVIRRLSTPGGSTNIIAFDS